MRVATSASCALLACLSCSNPSEPERNTFLETDKTAYVATDDPDPRFDFAATVIVKFRNETDGVVRIHRCTATTTHPPYIVEPAGSGQASWNPDIACASSTPYHDLASGLVRTDTLVLRSPWQRLFNGQPVGETEGNFYLNYEVQICGSVTPNGQCFIPNVFEYARSNRFTIALP